MKYHREHKIVHAVPCPVCRAGRGEPCNMRTQAERATAGMGIDEHVRLVVHGERRAAWKRWKLSRDVDVYAQPLGHVLGGRAGVLTPKNPAARAACIRCAFREQADGTYRVEDLRAAIDCLTIAGLLVE